jgi:exodeoxyribonuclease VII small subunit
MTEPRQRRSKRGKREEVPEPAGGEPSFEESLERLEGVVRELESGSLSLEESLARFEEGVTLAKRCSSRLEAAQLQIKRLEDGPDGAVEKALDDEEPA